MPLKTLCEFCHCEEKMSRCSLCKLTKYCSRVCQAADAAVHKPICPAISRMDLEEKAWRKWMLANADALAKMMAPDHVVELTIEDETVIVTEFSKSDYLATLSTGDADHLGRVTALADKPHIESVEDVKESKFVCYRIKKVDTPTDVTHVDGQEVIPTTVWPGGLLVTQYSAGLRFEYIAQSKE